MNKDGPWAPGGMRVKIRKAASAPLVGPPRISLEISLPNRDDRSAARTGPRVSFTLSAHSREPWRWAFPWLPLIALCWATAEVTETAMTIDKLATSLFLQRIWLSPTLKPACPLLAL